MINYQNTLIVLRKLKILSSAVNSGKKIPGNEIRLKIKLIKPVKITVILWTRFY